MHGATAEGVGEKELAMSDLVTSKADRPLLFRLPRKSWHARLPVRLVQFALDPSTLCAAFFLSYLLRFEFRIPRRQFADFLQQLPWVVLIQFAGLAFVGVYSFIWRYVGLVEDKAFCMRPAVRRFRFSLCGWVCRNGSSSCAFRCPSC